MQVTAEAVRKRALACVLAATAVACGEGGEDAINELTAQLWPDIIDFSGFEIALEACVAIVGAAGVSEEFVAAMATQAINEATTESENSNGQAEG